MALIWKIRNTFACFFKCQSTINRFFYLSLRSAMWGKHERPYGNSWWLLVNSCLFWNKYSYNRKTLYRLTGEYYRHTWCPVRDLGELSATTSPTPCDYVTQGADRSSLLTFLFILAVRKTACLYSPLCDVGILAAEWTARSWPVVIHQH